MSIVTEESEVPSEQLNYDLSVADAIWVAAAYLQKGSVIGGNQEIMGGIAYTDQAIAQLVESLRLTKAAKPSILQHIRQHCVANKEPKPNRSCILYVTKSGGIRLYRDSDPRHPGREGATSHPKWENLPEKFDDLRQWYETVWNSPSALIANDPLLNAIGTGKGLFGDQGADAYVNSLRDGWDDPR